MPDVWSMATDLDESTQSRLAVVLEARGSDVSQRAMRNAFLESIPFQAGARVLDVGHIAYASALARRSG